MTAEHPETGTLRQALEAKIEEWRNERHREAVDDEGTLVNIACMAKEDCADELEELLDDHRSGGYEVPVKETGGGSE